MSTRPYSWRGHISWPAVISRLDKGCLLLPPQALLTPIRSLRVEGKASARSVMGEGTTERMEEAQPRGRPVTHPQAFALALLSSEQSRKR